MADFISNKEIRAIVKNNNRMIKEIQNVFKHEENINKKQKSNTYNDSTCYSSFFS